MFGDGPSLGSLPKKRGLNSSAQTVKNAVQDSARPTKTCGTRRSISLYLLQNVQFGGIGTVSYRTSKILERNRECVGQSMQYITLSFPMGATV